jgi:hypothetical protein
MGKYGLTLKTMPSGVYPLIGVMVTLYFNSRDLLLGDCPIIWSTQFKIQKMSLTERIMLLLGKRSSSIKPQRCITQTTASRSIGYESHFED